MDGMSAASPVSAPVAPGGSLVRTRDHPGPSPTLRTTNPRLCGADIGGPRVHGNVRLARTRSNVGPMSDAVAGLIGALVGGAAAIAGAWLQIRAERKAAREEREASALAAQAEQRELTNQRRRALAARYLFSLQDATESLRRRLENWAEQAGQGVAEASDPGYWDITTLYVVARALAAERILALEGVYPALEADLPELVEFFKSDGVESALDDTLGERLFRYHRLALAEAALERDVDGFRVLIYSEFRRRYEDPGWGLQRLLAPATDALNALTKEQMRELEGRFGRMAARLETATRVPRKT
jgi:hypothetical protein